MFSHKINLREEKVMEIIDYALIIMFIVFITNSLAELYSLFLLLINVNKKASEVTLH